MARYEINDFWLADTDINYASDSLYLKDLSLPYKDNAWADLGGSACGI